MPPPSLLLGISSSSPQESCHHLTLPGESTQHAGEAQAEIRLPTLQFGFSGTPRSHLAKSPNRDRRWHVLCWLLKHTSKKEGQDACNSSLLLSVSRHNHFELQNQFYQSKIRMLLFQRVESLGYLIKDN